MQDILQQLQPESTIGAAGDVLAQSQGLASIDPLAYLPKDFDPMAGLRAQTLGLQQQQNALLAQQRLAAQPFQMPQPTLARSTPEHIAQGLTSGLNAFMNVRGRQQANALAGQQVDISRAYADQQQQAIDLSNQINIARAEQAKQQAMAQQNAIETLSQQFGIPSELGVISPQSVVDISKQQLDPKLAGELQGQTLSNQGQYLGNRMKQLELDQMPTLNKLDVAKRLLDIDNATLDNSIKGVNLQALPEEKQQQLYGLKLDNALKYVKSVFAPGTAIEELTNAQLTNKEKSDKINNIRRSFEVFDNFISKDQKTPADIAEVTATLQMLSGDSPDFGNIMRSMLGLKPGTALDAKKIESIYKPAPAPRQMTPPPAASFNPAAGINAPKKGNAVSLTPQTIKVPGGANVILQPKSADTLSQKQRLIADEAAMNRGMVDIANRGVQAMDQSIAGYRNLSQQAANTIADSESYMKDFEAKNAARMDKLRSLF